MRPSPITLPIVWFLVRTSEPVEVRDSAVTDDDRAVKRSGRRTYRIQDGRPHWARATDLVLPDISPPEGNGVEDLIMRQSGSADHGAGDESVILFR